LPVFSSCHRPQLSTKAEVLSLFTLFLVKLVFSQPMTLRCSSKFTLFVCNRWPNITHFWTTSSVDYR